MLLFCVICHVVYIAVNSLVPIFTPIFFLDPPGVSGLVDELLIGGW
jgi:hypothetical protein